MPDMPETLINNGTANKKASWYKLKISKQLKQLLMLLFKILWGIDSLASAIIIYFFFVGLADGTVSPFNLGLWLAILLVIGGVMLGSIWLKSHQHPALSTIVLCIIAVPALLFGAFMLIAIFSGNKWN